MAQVLQGKQTVIVMYEYKFIPCSIGSDFAYTSGNTDIDETVNEYAECGWEVDRIVATNHAGSDKGVLITLKRKIEEEEDTNPASEKPAGKKDSLLEDILAQDNYSVLNVTNLSEDMKSGSAFVRDLAAGTILLVSVRISRKEHQASTARMSVTSWSEPNVSISCFRSDAAFQRQYEPRFRSMQVAVKDATEFLEMLSDAQDSLCVLDEALML